MSETKRTIAFSRANFKGQGGEKSSKHTRQQRGKFFRHKERNSVPSQKLQKPDMASSRVSKLASLSPDAYMEENRSVNMLRLRRRRARSQRKVVPKDQLHYWRSLHNWVVYLKIPIRESPFHAKKENWDQNSPSIASRAPGTK